MSRRLSGPILICHAYYNRETKGSRTELTGSRTRLPGGQIKSSCGRTKLIRSRTAWLMVE